MKALSSRVKRPRRLPKWARDMHQSIDSTQESLLDRDMYYGLGPGNPHYLRWCLLDYMGRFYVPS